MGSFTWLWWILALVGALDLSINVWSFFYYRATGRTGTWTEHSLP